MERDKTIDNLRGFAMFWVIVVHVLYWGNFFTHVIISAVQIITLILLPNVFYGF